MRTDANTTQTGDPDWTGLCGSAHPAQFLVLQSQDPGALSEELHLDRRQRVSGGEVALGPPPEKHPPQTAENQPRVEPLSAPTL